MKSFQVRGRQVCLAALLVLLAASALPLSASDAQPSYDVVPRPSWMYDAFSRLAADGALGNLDPQDISLSRTYTRIEMAQMLGDLAEEPELTPSQQFIALQLADELKEEADFLDLDLSALYSDAPDALDTGVAWAAAQWKREAGDDTIVSAANATYLGLRGRGVSFGATFTNERRLDSDAWRKFNVLDRAHYRSRGREWSWELAKGYTWLGTAGTGSLYLGDAGPSLFLARARKTFSLGSWLGRWRFETQAAGFREQGDAFYVLSKSLRKSVGKQWTFALYDLVKTTETPNPLMLVAPLQLYQAALLTDIDRKWNGMMGLEAVYHPNPRLEMYGQWMVDDISNPFDPNPNTPKKTGVLIGVRGRPGKLIRSGPRYQIEYASIDSRAYEATRASVPLLAWTNESLPLAWPFGAGQRTLSARAELPLSERLDLTAGVLSIDPRSNGGRQTVYYAEPAWRLGSGSNLSLQIQRHTGADEHWVTSMQLMAWY